MSTRTLPASVVAVALAATACSPSQPDHRVQMLEQKVDSLNAAVVRLAGDAKFNEAMAEWDKIAFLKIGDSGFSTVKTDLGYVTISISDVTPYANGSRVLLVFGNPTSATLSGVSFNIDWGKLDEKGNVDRESERTKAVTLNQRLEAGTWTREAVILDGLPSAQLGYLRVSDVKHKAISLRG